ncbi:M14 family metallopeptidase [Candidatus Izimaplasma sp. ZiA1]|uniref:M14 family metallopeptidase n=1 Tax=Candidatus Izimoplasma sp. ZiA1 TaxID=2024899 RepID=UPI001439C555
MFVYPKNYDDAKKEFIELTDELKKQGYHLFKSQFEISDGLFIDKVVIKAKKEAKNRIVFSSGLHGIEGFVGHCAIKHFVTTMINTLSDETEIVIYHTLNPYGMKHLRRSNENNIDLNRNFSSNNFSNENKAYKKAIDFFTPVTYKGIKTANIAYYKNIGKAILKHGSETFKEATLLGQNSFAEGIYYSGKTFEKSTIYMLNEFNNLFNDVGKLVYIDLHTGYGPRYQMSVVNSLGDKYQTINMKKECDYPLILGEDSTDFYDIDGDMIEKLYLIKREKYPNIDFYGTCFEFGTLGDSTKKTIESLKAMIFENASFFKPQTENFVIYSDKLMREQYMPSEEEWRKKANLDFNKALKEIVKFKNI